MLEADSVNMETQPAPDPILDGLDPEQLAVVTHGTGPQLVVAGAGTGKTAVITRRIAHLVATKVCRAREILALTYTDKAAAEMEGRVDVLVPYGFTDSTICTFHAFGERTLREQGLLLGLSPDYRVLTQPEQLVFLREHLFELPLERLRPLSDPTRHLELILGVISRAKDEDVSPARYLELCETRLAAAGSDDSERARWSKQIEVARVFARYQDLLRAANLMDFGDLITLTLELFRRNPEVLEEFRARYRFLLVDEFQDTNAAQFELVRLLAGAEADLTVVGDDDQSIYKFRGAALSNILQFTQHYPQARIRVLNRNYRSTQGILDGAYRLIRHNDPERLEVTHQLDKRLRAERGAGQGIGYRRFDTVSSEAEWIAGEIERSIRDGRPPSDHAVLVRTNHQADPYLRALAQHGLPFRFSGSQGLYRRPEVRLCLSFLRALADPSNSLAVHELAASELYDLPAADLARLNAAARRRHQPLLQVLTTAKAADPDLSPEAASAIARLSADLATFGEAARRLSSGQVLYRFLTESGLLARYTAQEGTDAELAVRNLGKFFNLIKGYERLARSDRVYFFVQHLDMLQEAGDDPAVAEADLEAEAVAVLTVHRAKGLEFPKVYLPGLSAGRFPPTHQQAALDLPAELTGELLPKGDVFTAEERRLFYVGMTRARDELHLSAAVDYGSGRAAKPSRFVLEAVEWAAGEARTWTASALESIRTHAPVPEIGARPLSPLASDQLLTLSHSQIRDFMDCPLRYKYAHVLQIPVLPHHSILYGNALHSSVQAYFQARLKQGTNLSVAQVQEKFREAWVNEGFISREHEEMRLQAGLNAIKRLVEKETITPSKTTQIETTFSYTLNYTKVIGRLDRVDRDEQGRAVIVDLKSTEVTEQEDADERAKKSLQMKIYASGWRHQEGEVPARVELHFLESGLVGRHAITRDEIDKADEKVLEVAEEVRKQEFPAKPGPYTCSFCGYRPVCPKAL